MVVQIITSTGWAGLSCSSFYTANYVSFYSNSSANSTSSSTLSAPLAYSLCPENNSAPACCSGFATRTKNRISSTMSTKSTVKISPSLTSRKSISHKTSTTNPRSGKMFHQIFLLSTSTGSPSLTF